MRTVVFDCERMKYRDTGLYSYCLNLGNHLLRNNRKGEENITIYGNNEVSGNFIPDTPAIAQNSFHKFLLPSLKKYDIWHCTYQNSDYVPQLNKKIKVVLSIHDLNFLYEKKNEQKKLKYLRHLQKNIDRSDAIVCISEFCKRDVLTYCRVDDKPVHVIYNGTNSLSKPGLSQTSYRPERPFLFSLGMICRKKNFHVLLPLIEQNQHLELLIAGRHQEPAYVQYIISNARKLRIEDNLRVLSSITEREKSWYYRHCYAFAFPSLAEGFGLPVTEAMSVGKPVFLSDRTALPEIGSDSAFYFRDFNAGHMQEVFTNGMRQYEVANMHDSIIKRSSSFSWDLAAAQYLEIYRSLQD